MKIIYENEELGPSQGREKPTTTYKNIKIGAFEDMDMESLCRFQEEDGGP